VEVLDRSKVLDRLALPPGATNPFSQLLTKKDTKNKIRRGILENGDLRMKNRFGGIWSLIVIALMVFLFTGCGVFIKKNVEKEEKLLTINRLWQMHEDVNYVYFYYEDGSVESGLMLKWVGDRIKVQKKDENIPIYIPSEGIISIKAVTGNRIWQLLAAGSALAAGYYFLVGAGDLGGESLGAIVIKMFGAPLIVMASVAYGASSEKTETYRIPEDFEFNFDSIKRIHNITE